MRRNLKVSRIYKRRLKLEKMSQKGQMLTLEKLSKSVVSLANQSELILTIVYTKLENVSCFTERGFSCANNQTAPSTRIQTTAINNKQTIDLCRQNKHMHQFRNDDHALSKRIKLHMLQ